MDIIKACKQTLNELKKYKDIEKKILKKRKKDVKKMNLNKSKKKVRPWDKKGYKEFFVSPDILKLPIVSKQKK